MANILVLVPMKPSIPDALKKRAEGLLFGLHVKEKKIGKHRLEVHQDFCRETGDGRPYSAHAAARNTMLDMYLKKTHTHVLWIDADVVEYPTDLATRLHAIDAEGIIAPLPLIENTVRFYDCYGFVGARGQRAERVWPPYMEMTSMQSVGTCYLAPASLYHAGARYEPTEGHTEHYSVCRKAKRVSVARDVVVYHADLPKWGEAWNGL